MIHQLTDAPANVAAFEATGAVTKEDFEQVVMPVVKQRIEQFGELNYLLLLNTDLHNFTVGAWWEDALLGLKNLTKWNRAAIVTDTNTIIQFTDIFSFIAPGDYKGFKKHELASALHWVSSGSK